MIEEAIKLAVDRKNLTRVQSAKVFEDIMNGQATDAQIASLITALRMKGETIEEIRGAAEAMRKISSKVSYSGNKDILDIVGTGGDNKNAFNISTAAAFVAAGAGCIVAKHGNRSVSSQSGSADVLESLGVNIETTPEKNSKILSKIGIAFLYAPRHHPAMKYAVGPRREIGIRTIFNILGPITNPAGANTYLLGVYSEDMAEKLAFVLAGLETKRALVVNGSGYDEVSLTGKTLVFEVENGKVSKKEFKPADFGFRECKQKDLEVMNSGDSAKIIEDILSGKEKGCRRDIVLLNAGCGIYANGRAGSPKEGVSMARESIDAGKALGKLEALIEESKK